MSRTSIAIEISRESARWDALADLEPAIARAVAATLATAGLDHAEGAELSIVLTDDAGIAAINGEWRAKPKATNVLSFPAAPAQSIAVSPLLGDIVLAHETIMREAEAEGITVTDHVVHLTVHGLLHIFGYDHEANDAADAMEALETRILAGLGIADPYGEPPPRHAAG